MPDVPFHRQSCDRVEERHTMSDAAEPGR
jgi:hypothetical protein